MKISHIMSRLKILSNLCETRQKTRIVYNVLAVKEFW